MERPIRYGILKDKRVQEIENIEEWVQLVEKMGTRALAKDMHVDSIGIVTIVSTVFTGINYNQPGKLSGWFETVVYGGPHDGKSAMYETYDEAMAGHKMLLQLIVEKAKKE